MKLFIRNRPRWCNFLHTVEELRQFEEGYIPNTSILIGDLATFNKPMMSKLLKLLEENPLIDCYSSQDIPDQVLLSRFVQVVKDPISLESHISEESFLDSDKDYQSVELYLDLPNDLKLLATGQSKFGLTLLSADYARRGN